MTHFQKILFPVDFSGRSHAAAPFILSMARRWNAQVVLLHAIPSPVTLYAGMDMVCPDVFDFSEASRAILSRLTGFADTELPKVERHVVVEMGDAACVITEYAKAKDFDLIAMPTHGYGTFRHLLLGSVTAKVLHDSALPVWTAAHAPEPGHRAHPEARHILCAIDLKPESAHTLETAIRVARETGATVEVLHVAPEGEAGTAVRESRLHEILVKAEGTASVQMEEYAVPDADIVHRQGGIAQVVRAAALKKRADLVVIGRGSIQCAFGRLASNAYEIVRESPCPVLSV